MEGLLQGHKGTAGRRTPRWSSGSLRLIVNVADSAHRPNNDRLCRVHFDFAAQARDADIDAAIEWVPGPIVGAFEDLVAVQHAAAVEGEKLQKIELHGCDGN